ncbi:helicase associated domain-containing protein [Gordonia alkanivorans]|uniref:helicase associated domain-containing protein n=1 Tax=Gordonia alkanivorans TaxID=84096 RepID=UPI0005A9D934|nr:helicase associated domain-containing protein [Gordonia alkanivorans]
MTGDSRSHSGASDRFDEGIAYLHRYVAIHGTSLVPRHAVVDGFAIGVWVDLRRSQYREGRLPADRVTQLESEFTDWRWNVYDSTFEEGIARLHRYVAVHGTSNARQRDTIDGFRIGLWVANRRSDYHDGRLPAERVQRIKTEFQDWQWNVHDSAFEVGLEHLRRYVELHGTSRVPRTAVIDGFKVGLWVANRRKAYKAGRLPRDRAVKFEAEFVDWQWTVRNPSQ